MLGEPIAQALLFFVISLVASVAIVVLVRSHLSMLGALVRAAMVFALGLFLWLGWSALDAPAWGGIEIGSTTWPLGVLAVITGGSAFALELLARRMGIAESRAAIISAEPQKPAEPHVPEPAGSDREQQVAPR